MVIDKKSKLLSRIALTSVLIYLIIYCVFIQFSSPTLYGADSYYHIAATRFLKDFGPRYDFPWAQFSTFKDFFSDKEFLFHLLTVPFLYLSDKIITAGKYAVIFYNILFITVYIFILKKYVPDLLAALLLLGPFLSSVFSIYFLYLRPWRIFLLSSRSTLL
ncbi:MAG: hypothetical protein ABH858_06275 [Candidatus Omnitrophota bacterium]